MKLAIVALALFTCPEAGAFRPSAGPRPSRFQQHRRAAPSMKAVSGGEPNQPEFLKVAAAAALAGALSTAVPMPANAAPPTMIPYSTLLREINENQVEQLTFSANEKTVVVKTVDGNTQVSSVLPSTDAKLVDTLVSKDIPFSVQGAPEPGGLANAVGLISQLIFPLFLLSLFLGPRLGGGGMPGGGMGGPGGGIMDMGKAKSKLEMEPETGVKFEDVAGCEGSKLELREVVEFLTDPGKYEKVGAKAPRGVVMEGPPGTGKTLLARAVAGEAGVPFISASGSEFVEMFVGVGASRVRDIFTKAKKNAPCIVFIDEIDAVGKSRSGQGGRQGGNDEQEQTLNQILTEMDGFEGNSGVVVIAATNRADVLDPALLRPGRFDRRVPVDLPDRTGRGAILRVHARSKPLDDTVDLDMLAARTTGFSGASLANLLNEAAIVAARRSKDAISMSEVEFALDRIQVGMEKRTGMSSGKRKELVAYHEAGHALMGALSPGFDEVGKVTIVPRSNGAGGFTLFVPSEELQDSGMYSKSYLKAQLAVALGGRVAEELAYGVEEVTTGASGDLQRVADVARRMVTQWGYSLDTIGATAWESPNGGGFGAPKMASEVTEEKIDAEVRKLVDEAYNTCKETLMANRRLLDEITKTLVEEETIGNDQLKDLVKEYRAAIPESALSAAAL